MKRLGIVWRPERPVTPLLQCFMDSVREGTIEELLDARYCGYVRVHADGSVSQSFQRTPLLRRP